MNLLLAESLFFLSFVFFYVYYFQFLTRKPPTKGFKTYPVIGLLPEFLKNRHRFLEWNTEVLRECPNQTAVFVRPGKVQVIMTASPANVEHMLKTNFENYPKGKRFSHLLEDFIGNGIFNSDGHLWRHQRKTASYEFNTRSLRNFIMENVTVEIEMRLLPMLYIAVQTNRVVDMQDVLERFAFDNVCKLAFNVDPACLDGDGTSGAEFMLAFEDAAMLSFGRFLCVFPWLWKVKKRLNIGTERRLKQAIATVHEFADEIIRSRMNSVDPTHDNDLLSRFIATEDSSPEFLRDIVISFILAGRDTTSSALSWFFWILSSRPDVTEKIREEIEAIRSRNRDCEGSFGYEELKEMQYLHAAISEAMRLYPPVAVNVKSCRSDDVLPDGTEIKRGWFMSYHSYAMGRMESVWGKDCLEFKPERWLENGVYRPENPFRFPVFHGGPRMCLGKEMAYIQMKSIAASVIEKFEIEAVGKDKRPEPLLSLTLRMKGGLPVKIRIRDAK